MNFELTEQQIERYSRNIVLPEVGGKGQKKLLSAKVLIIGTGGLGSPCAFYLAASGVGKIGIVDSDDVELSNLQRQIIHFTKDIGRPKSLSAEEKLKALNPDVKIEALQERLTSKNILNIIKEYDFIVDGSDNFPTKFLVNDACVLTGKPFSHGGIFRFDGQTMTVIPGKGPCYRCLFPEPPPKDTIPSCQEAGILGAVAGVIGVIQATEVLKFILGTGDLLVGRLLVFNALQSNFRIVRVPKSLECPVCGKNPSIKELIDYELVCEIQNSKTKER